MTKSMAIRKFCLECVCNSWLDVALCTGIKCPLWEHRLGCSKKSKSYKNTMSSLLRSHPKQCAALVTDYGLDQEIYFGKVKS